MRKIKETFNLRSEGEMDYFWGHNIGRKNNGLWAASAKTSIHKMIMKVEQEMSDMPLAKVHIVAHDHPEEDSSSLLNPLGIHNYQMIIGCINWITTLVRKHVSCYAS